MKTRHTRWLCLHVLLVVGLWPAANVVGSEEASLPKDVPSLIKLLRDKDPKLRASAADRLGDMHGKAAAAVPALVGLLGDEELGEPHPLMPWHVWRAAQHALASIGPPATAELIKALESSDARIRDRAASALGEMDRPPKESLSALLRLLHDTSEEVRNSAVWTLGRMEKDAQRAIPLLIELSENDPNQYVREQAITAVAALDSDGTRAIPACIQALQDKKPFVRGEAARALGGYGPRAKAAVPALAELLGDKEGYYRALYIDYAEYCFVQCDAVEALGKIGPAAASALPKLREMLHPEGGGVVQAAVACALLRIDPQDKKALPALSAMLKESQRETYESDDAAQEAAEDARFALAALGNIGPPAAEAVPDVKKALQHQYPYVQYTAVAALAAIARKDAVPFLIEKMKEEKCRVDAELAADKDYFEESARESIVAALGNLGADAAAAVPALSAILADGKTNWFLGETVIESLGKMGAAAAASAPQLIAMLDRDDDNTRSKTIVALGRIGPAAKAAAPRLLEISQSDPDEETREAARAAIQEIKKDKGDSTEYGVRGQTL